jgi:hypothetical protein
MPLHHAILDSRETSVERDGISSFLLHVHRDGVRALAVRELWDRDRENAVLHVGFHA